MPKVDGLKISIAEAMGYLPSPSGDRFAQVFERVFTHSKLSVLCGFL
ncbi:hypothetical protein [Pseudanabaena sp. PCC 6802]|nr:hypothetical protein [Pseudanabaena sp. PCC 6802]